jgi:three-Cys-motif partner protein
MPSPLGSDGLHVRDTGAWARRKLEFLDRYLPAALDATARKRRRVYVDLFAGPGRNVSNEKEFPGAALKALKAISPGNVAFTDAVMVNLLPTHHRALEARVDALCRAGDSRVPRERISLRLADANDVAPSIITAFNPRDYLLVFADIEAPRQLSFNTIRSLKPAGYQSVDLYVLFPLDMGVQRLIAYDPATRDSFAAGLDEYFGTPDWRELAREARINPGRRDSLRRRLTELYCRQLRTVWKNADEMLDVYLRNRQRLYKMIFAESSGVANRIKSHIRSRMNEDQNLPLFNG